MSDFTLETRPGERWWEMLSQKPHCVGGTPYKAPTWYHDYGTQIEMAKYRYYTYKVGYPLIVCNGVKMTPEELAPMVGVSADQVKAHIIHGAIRYKDKIRWDYDFDEYAERIKAYEAEQERIYQAKEEEKDRRRAEVRANFEEMNRLRVEKIRQAHQSRREVFYSRFTFTSREDKPGKLRILYVNGERSTKAQACKALGFGEIVLLKQLAKGNFTFNGITVEVRYSDPQAFREHRNQVRREERTRTREERERERRLERERVREEKAAAAKERRRIYDQKRQAAKRAKVVKPPKAPKESPFRWEPYPEPVNNKRAVLYFRGKRLPEADTLAITGYGRDKCYALARKGRCFFPDGSVLEYIEDGTRGFRAILEEDPKITPAGRFHGKQKWSIRAQVRGKRVVFVTSLDLEALKNQLEAMLKDGSWKNHKKVVDIISMLG